MPKPDCPVRKQESQSARLMLWRLRGPGVGCQRQKRLVPEQLCRARAVYRQPVGKMGAFQCSGRNDIRP